MDNTFELIGVGSPIIDILAKVPDSFLEKVGGDKGGMVLTDGDQIAQWINELPEGSSQAPGGSAGNTVFAATRMGLQTSFIGKTGSDEGGEFYRSELQKLGGDTSRFKTGSIANGRCLSLITPDGERTLRTDLGAAATLSPDEVRPADFAGATHAHIEGYLLFNPDLMMQVLKSAKEANCRISLDLASFEVVKAAGDTLPDILNNYVDLVFANEEEAAAFHGSEAAFGEMAIHLGKYCELAVVKAGAKGAWLARGENVVFAPAVPGITAVDTTGAGDYWAAGFLSGWLRGKDLETCAALGARLGAEIVQVVGAELPESTWEAILGDIM